MLAVLVIAFILAAPFAALACGAWGHAIAHRVQAAQQASRYQVQAVVLEVPQASPAAGYTALAPEAQARWTAPDGKVVSVEVPVPAATAVGTVMRVWVTRDGQLTDAPLQDTQVAGQADWCDVRRGRPGSHADRDRRAGPAGAGQASDGRMGC